MLAILFRCLHFAVWLCLNTIILYPVSKRPQYSGRPLKRRRFTMHFAVLLHEDRHMARNYHGEGLELLREHGQVDLVTMRSGQETAAL